MGIRESIRDLRSVGQEELVASSLGSKAILGATVVGVGFEWSTGNEALLGFVGGDFFKASHNILMTTIATGATSFVEQSTLGALTVLSIERFPKIMDEIRRQRGARFEKKQIANDEDLTQAKDLILPEDNRSEDLGQKQDNNEIDPDLDDRTTGEQFLRAFALGTSVIQGIDNSDHKRSFRKNLKTVLKDARLIATGIIGIAFSASTLTTIGDKVGGTAETVSHGVVDALTNPFLYVGLFALTVAKRKIAKIRGNKLQPEEGL